MCEDGENLNKDDQNEHGGVAGSVYLNYFKAGQGSKMIPIFITLITIATVSLLFTQATLD